MSTFPTRHVVTCFIEFNGKILLLKRSQHVSSFKGKWAGISGYIEKDIDSQSLKEINEETTLEPADIQLLKKGDSLEIDDEQNQAHWIVHPYMYRVYDPAKIKLDWENCDMRWILPGEITCMDTVPLLQEALSQFINFGSY